MKRMINRILQKIRQSQAGSATVEAVVSFTGFLFVRGCKFFCVYGGKILLVKSRYVQYSVES